jgi:hypothetical protein
MEKLLALNNGWRPLEVMAHASLLASHWNQVLKQTASIKAKGVKISNKPL